MLGLRFHSQPRRVVAAAVVALCAGFLVAAGPSLIDSAAAATAPTYPLLGGWATGPEATLGGPHQAANGSYDITSMDMTTGAFHGTAIFQGSSYAVQGAEVGSVVNLTVGGFAISETINLSVQGDGNVGGDGTFMNHTNSTSGYFWAELTTPSAPVGTTTTGTTPTTTTPAGPTGPPVDVTAPVITGTARAGQTLSCSQGTWTNTPTAYAYQWYRDGTPVQGAGSPTYTVQSSDEQLFLICAVSASNAKGPGQPAVSASVAVPVPKVRDCPAAKGSLAGTTLGSVKLGMARREVRQRYAHSSNRGTKYEDFFCLTPIGVRVGYASPKLLDTLAKGRRKALADRVIWASTSSAYYTLKGVRVGATIAAASQLLKTGTPFDIGKNIWYLAPNGSSTAVLKVRRGLVEEIGIGANALTIGPKAQVNFLHSFS